MESQTMNNLAGPSEIIFPPESVHSPVIKKLPKYLVQLDKRKSCAFIILLKDQHLETAQIKAITTFLKKEKIINQDSKCYLAVLEENVVDDIYSGDTQIRFTNPVDSSDEAILVIKTLGLTRSNLENLILPSPMSPQKSGVDFPRHLNVESVGETSDHSLKDKLDETEEDKFSYDSSEPQRKVRRAQKTIFKESDQSANFGNSENNLECHSGFINTWAERLTGENLLPKNWLCGVTKRSEIPYDSVLNIFELESNSSAIDIIRSIQIFSDGSSRVFVSPFTCTDIFVPNDNSVETLETVMQIISKVKTYYPCAGFDNVEQNPKTAAAIQHGQKWYSRVCDRIMPIRTAMTNRKCPKCILLESSFQQIQGSNITFDPSQCGNSVYVYRDGKFDVGQTIYANFENFWDELKIAEAAKEFKSLPAKERR